MATVDCGPIMQTPMGWCIHRLDDEQYPFGSVYHTHGLRETFGHPDLQVVLPIPSNIAEAILNKMVSMIKGGRKFKVCELATGIIDPGRILLVGAYDGRSVLRLILPDKNGCLDPESMTSPFARQFEDDDGIEFVHLN